MGRIKGKPHAFHKLEYLVADWEAGATLESLAKRHGCTRQNIENSMRLYVKLGIASQPRRDAAVARVGWQGWKS